MIIPNLQKKSKKFEKYKTILMVSYNHRSQRPPSNSSAAEADTGRDSRHSTIARTKKAQSPIRLHELMNRHAANSEAHVVVAR
jgi:hypothetical protein